MSDCCKRSAEAEKADLAFCQECAQRGRTVQRITLESLLWEECKTILGSSQYHFCLNHTCKVVYFSNEDGAYFHTSDLRIRVGQKETEDPIPVCYCFGHTRASICQEIRETGKSTVITNIDAKVKAGLCNCQISNPQGSCCLGEVGQVVKKAFAGCQ